MTTTQLPSYIDFINTQDERFKLALLWWYTLPNALNDYEFSWRILQQNVSTEDIKTILKDRLIELLIFRRDSFRAQHFIRLIRQYFRQYRSTVGDYQDKRSCLELIHDQHVIDDICDTLFKLVYDNIYKSSKDSYGLFHCWNRVIRNFRDANIVSDNKVDCYQYVNEFRKSKGYSIKNIKIDW